MASWQDEYLAALEARDEVEKANLGFYEACNTLSFLRGFLTNSSTQDTRVADRSAQLVAAPSSAPPPVDSPSLPPPIVDRRGTSAAATPLSALSESHKQLRIDLAKAQQERAELQARLDRTTKEVERLRSRSKVDSKRITQLTSELSQLSVRVRDRDEESRGKAKLLDNVQDEVVTLNLQLNMAEDEVKKVRKENQELVDRWMKRKGQEADRMNEDSSF
jgi:septal ring factor EnvC (AmiA/AmiB activator)